MKTLPKFIKEMFDPLAVVLLIFVLVIFIVGYLIVDPMIEKSGRAKALAKETEWSTAYDKGFTDGIHATLKHAPIPKGSEIDFAPILKESQAADRYKEQHKEP